jgi:predicted DNA-binding protein
MVGGIGAGRKKGCCVPEAIAQPLEDLEDVYLARQALERNRKSPECTIPIKDVMKRYGLVD